MPATPKGLKEVELPGFVLGYDECCELTPELFEKLSQFEPTPKQLRMFTNPHPESWVWGPQGRGDFKL